MRLFFAVELAEVVQAALGELQGVDTEYRWVDPALMHVTLVFLGEQPPEKLEQLKTIGQNVASNSQAGMLTLGGAGTFGPPGAPRVLWVGLIGDLSPLRHVQQRLVDELRANGFALEDRAFSPHITLARRRGQARARNRPPPWPPTTSPPGPFHAPMDHLTLFESQLSPKGARYTPLAHFPLAGL